MTMYLAWRVSPPKHLQLWVDSLVAYQHLHVLFDHEVIVIGRQCLGSRVVPEHHIVSLLKVLSASSPTQGRKEAFQLNMNFAKSL